MIPGGDEGRARRWSMPGGGSDEGALLAGSGRAVQRDGAEGWWAAPRRVSTRRFGGIAGGGGAEAKAGGDSGRGWGKCVMGKPAYSRVGAEILPCPLKFFAG